MFSNARLVLSQCNTRHMLLYLLNSILKEQIDIYANAVILDLSFSYQSERTGIILGQAVQVQINNWVYKFPQLPAVLDLID